LIFYKNAYLENNFLFEKPNAICCATTGASPTYDLELQHQRFKKLQRKW
jgi:hypothetical protein